MLAEFALGRRARADIVTAFCPPDAPRAWAAAGLIAMLGAFLILGYGAVVAGWTVKYLADYVRVDPETLHSEDQYMKVYGECLSATSTRNAP